MSKEQTPITAIKYVNKHKLYTKIGRDKIYKISIQDMEQYAQAKVLENQNKMSKKEKEYKKRLKYIYEDVMNLCNVLPDIDYNESMYDWESINMYVSNIESASNLKDDEYTNWKTKFDVPTHDPQTGELNPYYEELTGKKNPLTEEKKEYLYEIKEYIKKNPIKDDKDLDKMPNQKWHQIVSFIKSGVRIVGYCFIPFNLVVATILLVLSEVIGILEEMV